MGQGLKLRITNTRDQTTLERTFDRFPVRIGRNPLNDMQLEFPFVSQFHATIEQDPQGQVVLRDLGSKNGTLLRGSGRMPPNTTIALTAANFEFAIVTLIFQATPVAQAEAAPQPAKRRAGTVLSMSTADASKLTAGQPAHPSTSAMPAVRPGTVPPAAADHSAALIAQLKPLYDAYRASWAQVYRVLYSAGGTLDPQSRALAFRRVVDEQPALAGEVDFQRLAAHFGVALATPTAGTGAASKEESVALQGLKELASWYLPGSRPLEGVPDIVAFLQKLQDAMDVFLKCFVPLRDGYKQFETQMDIKKTARPGGSPYGPAGGPGGSVETARDPRELAAKLLDWKDQSNEGPRAIESTFADLMIHQVAMLNGVMKGVKSLLANLSPNAIERALDDPKSKKAGGFGPFRYKNLWELYAEVHSDYADEEKEAFSVIFGKEFVGAYTQLAGGEALGPRRGNAQTAAPGTFGPGTYPPGGAVPGQQPMTGAQPQARSVPPPPYPPPQRR